MISAILLVIALYTSQEDPCINFKSPTCVEKPCTDRIPLYGTWGRLKTCGSGGCHEFGSSCVTECPSDWPYLGDDNICYQEPILPTEAGSYSKSKLKSITPDSVGSEEEHPCALLNGNCKPCLRDDWIYLDKLYDCEWENCRWNHSLSADSIYVINEECLAECPSNAFIDSRDCFPQCSERNIEERCIYTPGFPTCYWDGTNERSPQCVDQCPSGTEVTKGYCHNPYDRKTKGGTGDSVKTKLAWIIPSSVGGLVVLLVAGILIKKYVSRRRSQGEEMEEGTGSSGDAAPSNTVVLFENPSQ